MDRLERHERIIDVEYYLYGGVVDVPKIYDADSKHHSGRYVKGHPTGSGVTNGRGYTAPLGAISNADLDWLDTV